MYTLSNVHLGVVYQAWRSHVSPFVCGSYTGYLLILRLSSQTHVVCFDNLMIVASNS